MKAPATLSFVIPAYNGAKRVAAVVEAVGRIEWSGGLELLLVDNASEDQTTEVFLRAAEQWLRPKPRCVFRAVLELERGLTPARFRGLRESVGDIICFLDDDNLPAPGFVTALGLAFEDPAVGLAVPKVCPEYEVEPPPSLRSRGFLFAVNEHLGDAPIRWGRECVLAPTIGAGMALRKEAARGLLERHPAGSLMPDRKGRGLSSGGDIEIGALVLGMGYDRVYVPGAVLKHRIPPARFQPVYLARLVLGLVRSQIELERRYLGKGVSGVEWLRACFEITCLLIAFPLSLPFVDMRRRMLMRIAGRWARLSA